MTLLSPTLYYSADTPMPLYKLQGSYHCICGTHLLTPAADRETKRSTTHSETDTKSSFSWKEVKLKIFVLNFSLSL